MVTLSGDINLPPGGIVLPSPLEEPLIGVTVNGQEVASFSEREAVIDQFPATVVLRYPEFPASPVGGSGLQNTNLGLDGQEAAPPPGRDS